MRLLSLLLAFALHNVAFALTDSQLTVANAQLVKALTGENSNIRKIAPSYSNNSLFFAAKNSLSESRLKIRIASQGRSICQFTSATLLCMEPIGHGQELGVRFQNDDRFIFKSRSHDLKTLRGEFTKFLNSPVRGGKTALWELLMPNAFADKNVEDVQPYLGEVVFATQEYWRVITGKPTEEDGLLTWPEDYLNGREITCSQKFAKMSVHTARGDLNIEQKDSSSFIVLHQGNRYVAHLAPAKEQCQSGVAGTDCMIPFPLTYLRIEKCVSEKCDQVQELNDSEQESLGVSEVVALNKAFQELKQLNESLGRKVSIAQTRQLQKKINELNDLRKKTNDELMPHLLKTANAGVCCADTSCRQTVSKSQKIQMKQNSTAQ